VRLRLPSAWPNPFRNSVTVDVGAGISGSIRVLDVRGRLVRSLPVDPGTARVTWDGRTDGGVAAPAGKYLILAPGADRGVAVVKGD
jgi:flagellar hook assembly protein FlgD